MKKLLLSATLFVVSMASVQAEIIEIDMLNKNEAGDKMVFSQELIRAEVGDIVRFLPTDRAHNAQSVKGAIPEGQKPFKGKMNKTIDYEVTETGISAVVCLPHQAMGMVALIVVGNDLSNADQVLKAKIRGKKAKQKIEALIEEARLSIETDFVSDDESS